MNDIIIAPSILSADFADMGKGVRQCEEWGADWIHCDVMDGIYVPNITFGMPMVAALRMHSDLPFDVHLMILKPERYVGLFCDVGADAVTFHPDASDDVRGALEEVRSRGRLCGLVLNPDKGLDLIEPYTDIVDIILIMGVYAGFGGQGYIPQTTEKIRQTKALIAASGRNVRLEVDGGVSDKNIDEVLSAGADTIVAGSAVFKAPDPAQMIKKLRGGK